MFQGYRFLREIQQHNGVLTFQSEIINLSPLKSPLSPVPWRQPVSAISEQVAHKNQKHLPRLVVLGRNEPVQAKDEREVIS